jgi:hypothetical protein
MIIYYGSANLRFALPLIQHYNMPIIPPILMQPIAPIKKPAAPVKPKPGDKPTQDTTPTFAQDLFKQKETEFMDKTTASHEEIKTITLLSEFGYFKVYQYEMNIPKVKTVTQRTVFFVNKESKTVCDTHGHIALSYLDIIPDRTKVVDFPISNERFLKGHNRNKISRFSNYTLDWDEKTFKVTKKPYLNFDPKNENQLIAFNEEYEIGDKKIQFTNWKKVLNDANYKAYAKDRDFRKSGAPRQILLHETVTKDNLSINGVRPDKTSGTYFIPHFCVNNVDAAGMGNIIQFVDVAERVFHGEAMNNRSVGIEFVNYPIEQPNDGIILTTANYGVFLKTVLKNKPVTRLFIPLEFATEKASNNFELQIPKKQVLNVLPLKALMIDNKKIVTEDNDNIIIKYCKSEKFEHLVTLIKALSVKDILNIDLTVLENWRAFVVEDKKTYFVFGKAFISKKDEGDIFHFDIRQNGIWHHGFTGHHFDGYLQNLYAFLRIFKKMNAEETLKKLIELITTSNVISIKKKTVLKFQKKILSEVSDSKEVTVEDCLEIP